MGSGTYYSAEVNEDPQIKEFISDKLMQRVASDLTEGKANIPSIQMALKRNWQGEFKTILEPAKNSTTNLQEHLKRLKSQSLDAKQLA